MQNGRNGYYLVRFGQTFKKTKTKKPVNTYTCKECNGIKRYSMKVCQLVQTVV